MADVTIDRIREALDRAKSRALAWTPTDGLEPTWQMAASAVIALYENAIHGLECDGCAVRGGVANLQNRKPILLVEDDEGDGRAEFHLNKITHRLRFADEDEFSARVIVEPK